MTHSVWLTPEGKLVDVTSRTTTQDEDNLSTDKTIQYFIPVSTDGKSLLQNFYW